MATYKSEGIVFKSFRYRENSLIIDVFTYEKGLRSFIISGIGGSKSKNKAALFQHLNILDMVAYDKAESLARIKECRPAVHYQKLPYDIKRSSIGLFILELCKNAIQEREANPALYDFIKTWLVDLDRIENQYLPTYHLKFMLELAGFIGFAPSNNYSEENIFFDLYNGRFESFQGEKYFTSDLVGNAIHHLLDSKRNEAVPLTKSLRNEVIDQLVLFYILHIEGFKPLKSLDVLRSIF